MSPRRRGRRELGRSEPKEKVLTVRLPESVMLALEAQAQALAGQMPGVETSRSDVVRWLLVRALEQELGRPTRLPRAGR